MNVFDIPSREVLANDIWEAAMIPRSGDPMCGEMFWMARKIHRTWVFRATCSTCIRDVIIAIIVSRL